MSKRLPKRAIADATVAYLQAHGETIIGYGHLDALDRVANAAGYHALYYRTTRDHPLNRHKAVLDALDRDPRFEKFLFRCMVNGTRDQERLVRAFRLKASQSQETP